MKPAEEISKSERRKLAGFPEIGAEEVLSGKFAQDFKSTVQISFP